MITSENGYTRLYMREDIEGLAVLVVFAVEWIHDSGYCCIRFVFEPD
jgi:hypothetical protein